MIHYRFTIHSGFIFIPGGELLAVQEESEPQSGGTVRAPGNRRSREVTNRNNIGHRRLSDCGWCWCCVGVRNTMVALLSRHSVISAEVLTVYTLTQTVQPVLSWLPHKNQ